MKIFFIRHGETTGDIEDRYGGDYDDHLTEKGIEQSKQVAEQLRGRGIEAIYSSPLIRAQETSKIIADTVGCAVTVQPELKERNQYGILSGVTKGEAKQTHPELVEALKDRLNTIDGAESYEDFATRIQQGFEAVTKSTNNTIAVVWHGGPMRVLFRDILKCGEIKEIGDCSFVELEKEGDNWSKKNSDKITFSF